MLQRSPSPPAGFKGAYFQGKGREAREREEGREGILLLRRVRRGGRQGERRVSPQT